MDTGGKDGTIKHVFQGVNPKAAGHIQKAVMRKPVTISVALLPANAATRDDYYL